MNPARQASEGGAEPTARGRLHHVSFASHILRAERDLTVYLPPGYSRAGSRHYPVLYLHDGQNLFDDAEAAFGVSWQAHTTADQLIAASQLPPLVLVGIANTPDREDEYTPSFDPSQETGGRGMLYARFVAEEVMPFIDRHYRTLPDREHTGVAGSSLGGLISLVIARAYPDRFGLCAALSPSLWWNRGRFVKELRRDASWLARLRLWIDMGTREGDWPPGHGNGTQRTRRLVQMLRQAGGCEGRDYRYVEVPGGEHNEAAWAARFGQVLCFLFGDRG